eukprot:CAMPEP_0183581016 /NCGR_PEP_ID=MMETSP0371-20130417/146863_1 /TAXON_ID=268820 /ORGANISM="Peridinium aciculiferum, Strain PAER-2" /LENGTH=418 /DNA_ID=CAMNT_0025791661 /DNA_START=1 /DNA_END=1254 /DNA_ORIENTATION=+
MAGTQQYSQYVAVGGWPQGHGQPGLMQYPQQQATRGFWQPQVTPPCVYGQQFPSGGWPSSGGGMGCVPPSSQTGWATGPAYGATYANGWPLQMAATGGFGDFGGFPAHSVMPTSPSYGQQLQQQLQQHSGYGQQPVAPAASPEAVADFVHELGIDLAEEDEFSWIAEYGMQEDALPPGWTSQVDAQSGKLYYIDGETQASSWENPLKPYLLRVVDAGRMYLRAPDVGFWEERFAVLRERHNQELEAWVGPVMDASGMPYFANSTTGESSWQDPRERAEFCLELESNLLSSLSQVLPPPEELEVPTFGGSSSSRKVVTPSGAEVLTLEGDARAAAPPRARTRASRRMRSLALESSANERAGTLQSMGRAMLWLSEAAQAEELSQKRQLTKRVELRRLRKIRQASKDNRAAFSAAAAAVA